MCRWSTAGGVVLVVGGVALYLRFVKGWKLTDLMYVTRSSLSSLTENMKQGEGSAQAAAACLMQQRIDEWHTCGMRMKAMAAVFVVRQLFGTAGTSQ